MAEGSKDEPKRYKTYINTPQKSMQGFGVKKEKFTVMNPDIVTQIATGQLPDDIARNIDKPAKRKK